MAKKTLHIPRPAQTIDIEQDPGLALDESLTIYQGDAEVDGERVSTGMYARLTVDGVTVEGEVADLAPAAAKALDQLRDALVAKLTAG